MAKLRRNDPMLALVRDPLLSRVDRRLAAIMGASIVVHVAIAAYAWSTDLPEPHHATPPMSAIPVEYETIDIMIPDFTPPQKVTAPSPGATAPATPDQTPTPIVRRPTIRPAVATSDNVDPTKLAGLFTDNDTPSRRPKLDLDKAIIDARDAETEVGTNRNSDEDDRTHIGTRDESPITNSPTLTHVKPAERDVPGRVVPGTVKPQSSTTLTAALVLEWIQSHYIRGLQRCYQRGLATEGPSLAGKVAIEFTVEANGKVSDASASGMSSTVDACIEHQMTTWRFPAPRDGNGAATDATFSIALALQPS